MEYFTAGDGEISFLFRTGEGGGMHLVKTCINEMAPQVLTDCVELSFPFRTKWVILGYLGLCVLSKSMSMSQAFVHMNCA